jgi:TPR repeat protein/Flp pilus assembly protein TadD
MKTKSALALLGLVLATGTAMYSAQTAFPAKPLDRAQVLVWMDFGDESGRVIQLIGRVGIDFQPTQEYLQLLKDSGASTALIDSVTHAKMTPATAAMDDVAFGHLSGCMILAHKKQFAEAQKECSAVTPEEPGVTYFALGNLLLKAGDASAALEAFRSAEKADPGIPDTHNYAGLAIQALANAKLSPQLAQLGYKDFDGALKEYQQAIKLDHDYDTPHNNEAYIDLVKGDLAAADRDVREALRIAPDSASAHHNLASVDVKQKKLPEAIAEFRKAEALDPDSAFRPATLAGVLDATGDYATAATEYERAVALEPDNTNFHVGLIRALAEKKDMGALLTECDVVEQRFPADDRFRQVCAAVRGQARSAAPSTNAPAAAADASMFEPETIPAAFRGKTGEMEIKLMAMKEADFAAVQEKAAGGDVDSELLVCGAYRLGRFVAQDDVKAFPFCLKAAKQGNVAGQDNMGSMYMFGRGVARDEKVAMEWMTKAAAQGSYASMDNLGSMYADGVGVAQDYGKAMDWYRKAVEHGSMSAQTDIGIMYLMGQGVAKDPRQGIAWIRKSADADYPYANFVLSMVYQQGMGVSQSLKDSVAWMKKGASIGDARCETELGYVYANGVGVSRDYKEAAKWYRQSAEQGDAAGAYGLAVRYMMGQGVSRDYDEAEKWLKAAVEKGHGDAAYNLGVIYERHAMGLSGPPDHVAAAKYLQIAADQGIADGQCLLGTLYANGYGVAKDSIAAYQWMTLAAQNGNAGCSQGITPFLSQMSPDQIAEAKRRVAAWTPKPHPQFNY